MKAQHYTSKGTRTEHKSVKELKSEAEVEEFLAAQGRLITQEKYLTELSSVKTNILFRQKDLFEKPITIILEGN